MHWTPKEKESGNDSRQHQHREGNLDPTRTDPTFFSRLEFARQSRIPNLIRIKVGDVHLHTVLDFKRADVVQERSPALEFREILGNMAGQKDVPCIAAIHY